MAEAIEAVGMPVFPPDEAAERAAVDQAAFDAMAYILHDKTLSKEQWLVLRDYLWATKIYLRTLHAGGPVQVAGRGLVPVSVAAGWYIGACRKMRVFDQRWKGRRVWDRRAGVEVGHAKG